MIPNGKRKWNDMTIRISGKSINVGDALRERVKERINQTMGKYFEGTYSGHVTLSKDGFGFHTECAFHLDSGITLEASANAADAYDSADQAVARIEKRLRRYKSRIKDRHERKIAVQAQDLAAFNVPSYIIEAPSHDEEAEPGDFSPIIIAESTTALKSLSVSEAVTELDLTGAPVIVFRHGGNGRVNVIYRRADGNIGWIDPPPVS